MALLSASQVTGDIVPLVTTNPRHMLPGGKSPVKASKGESFSQLIMNALNGVNNLEYAGNQLSQQMVVNPSSVNPQDVTIALAKANLAVSLTKAVTDRVLQAYSNIINVR